jgi:hypothetical protein
MPHCSLSQSHTAGDTSISCRLKHRLGNSTVPLIPSFYSNCVVAVGHANESGTVYWGASGFLYGKPTEAITDPGKRRYRAYLVTNKHVLSGRDLIFVRVNPPATEPARGFEVRLSDQASGAQLWHGHEIDDVDVAVLPINYQHLLDLGMEVGLFLSDQHALNVAGLIDAETSEGDSVFVMGFPMGLVGEERNTVIVRAGVIARIRETLAKPTYRYLVDTVVFPGNSGGPVISKPEIASIRGTRFARSASLLGIVSSYVAYQDIAVSQQTGRVRVIFEENSGLAEAYSVDCIDQTIAALEEVTAGRARKEAQPAVSAKAADSGSEADK